LTKAGRYTYKVKPVFGYEINNTITILSFDSDTEIMFMGAVCDMNNSHNPVIDLPEMQVGESISNYTEKVVSFINDNDNICVMVVWGMGDTMDPIYEIQLNTVSADMFDFSKVDSSQEGYLFVKDYNGNTTTITLAVKVA
ncbi:MAG: hypothetical protein MJ066_05000, partial [Clostridia bacterium]|nr:hypothetical protein [Clostridia bacterium]